MSIKPISQGVRKYKTPKPHLANYHKLFYGKKHVPLHVLNTSNKVAFRIMRDDDVAMGVANALMLSDGVNYGEDNHLAKGTDSNNNMYVGSSSGRRMRNSPSISGSRSEAFASDKLSRQRGRGGGGGGEVGVSIQHTKFKVQRHNASVRRFIDLLVRQKKGDHALRVADLLERAGYVPNTSNYNALMSLSLFNNRRNHAPSKSTSAVSSSSSSSSQLEADAFSAGHAPTTANPLVGPSSAAELLSVKDRETIRRIAVAQRLQQRSQSSNQSNDGHETPAGSETVAATTAAYSPSTDLGAAVTMLWEQCVAPLPPSAAAVGAPTDAAVTTSRAVPPTNGSTAADAASNNIYHAAAEGYGWAQTLLLYQRMLSNKKHPDNLTLSFVMGAYKRGGLWAHCVNLFLAMLAEGGMNTTSTSSSAAPSATAPPIRNANSSLVISAGCFSLAIAAARQCPDYKIALEVFNMGVRGAAMGLVEVHEGVFISILRAVGDAQISAAYEIRQSMTAAANTNTSSSPSSSSPSAMRSPSQRHQEQQQQAIEEAVMRSNEQWASYALQLLESIPHHYLRITTINTALRILRRAGRSAEATALVGKIGAARVVKVRNVEQLVMMAATNEGDAVDADGKGSRSVEEAAAAEASSSSTSVIDNLLNVALNDAAMANRLRESPASAALGGEDTVSSSGGSKNRLHHSNLQSDSAVDRADHLGGIRNNNNNESNSSSDTARNGKNAADEDEESALEDYFFTSEDGPTTKNTATSAPSTDKNINKNKSSSNSRRSSTLSGQQQQQPQPLSPLAEKRFLFDMTLARMTPTTETMVEFNAIMTRMSDVAEGLSPLSPTEQNATSAPTFHRSYLLVSPSAATPPFASFQTPSSSDDALFTVYNWCRSLAIPIPTGVLAQLLLSLFRRGLNKTADAIVSSIIRDACLDPGNTTVPLGTLYKALSHAILHHPDPAVAETLLQKHHHRIGAQINPMTEGYGTMGDDANRAQWIFEAPTINSSSSSSSPTSSDASPKIAVVDAGILASSDFGNLFNYYDKIVVSYQDLVQYAATPAMANKDSPALKGKFIKETRPRRRFQNFLDGFDVAIVSSAEKNVNNSGNESQSASSTAAKKSLSRGSKGHSASPNTDAIDDYYLSDKSDRHKDRHSGAVNNDWDDEDILASAGGGDKEIVLQLSRKNQKGGGNSVSPSSSSSLPTRKVQLMVVPLSHQIYAQKFLVDPPSGYTSPQQESLRQEAAQRRRDAEEEEERAAAAAAARAEQQRRQNESKKNNRNDDDEDDEEDEIIGVRSAFVGGGGHRRQPAKMATSLSTSSSSPPSDAIATALRDNKKKMPNSTLRPLDPPPPLATYLGKHSSAPGLAVALMLSTLNRGLDAKEKEAAFLKKRLVQRDAKARLAQVEADIQQQLAASASASSSPARRREAADQLEQLEAYKRSIVATMEEDLGELYSPNRLGNVDYYVSSVDERRAAVAWLRQITTDCTLVDVRIPARKRFAGVSRGQ